MRLSRIPVLLILVAAFGLTANSQTIQINRDNKTIAISTTDEATETADIAAITVGFEILGPDSQSTYADAGKLSQAVLDALHKAGVEDKSIESSAQGCNETRNSMRRRRPISEPRGSLFFVSLGKCPRPLRELPR